MYDSFPHPSIVWGTNGDGEAPVQEEWEACRSCDEPVRAWTCMMLPEPLCPVCARWWERVLGTVLFCREKARGGSR